MAVFEQTPRSIDGNRMRRMLVCEYRQKPSVEVREPSSVLVEAVVVDVD